jgi:hypothetical protein
MSACMPEAVAEMVEEGFSIIRAYLEHLDLPIHYVAARSGIPVLRLASLESGNAASDDEADMLTKALDLPLGFLTSGSADRTISRRGYP